jgi:hypothetical protein
MTGKTVAMSKPPKPARSDPVEDLDTIKRKFEAETAQVKAALAHWIETNYPRSIPASEVAMLELAIKRLLTLFDPESTFDVVQAVYKEAIGKHQGDPSAGRARNTT